MRDARRKRREQKQLQEKTNNQKIIEEQRLREWEANFDKEQKIKENLEKIKEEKLKMLEMQQRRAKEEGYQNLSDDISNKLNDLDIKSTTKN